MWLKTFFFTVFYFFLCLFVLFFFFCLPVADHRHPHSNRNKFLNFTTHCVKKPHTTVQNWCLTSFKEHSAVHMLWVFMNKSSAFNFLRWPSCLYTFWFLIALLSFFFEAAWHSSWDVETQSPHSVGASKFYIAVKGHPLPIPQYLSWWCLFSSWLVGCHCTLSQWFRRPANSDAKVSLLNWL